MTEPLHTEKYSPADFDEVISFLGRLYRADRSRPYWLPGRWQYATYLVSPLFLRRGYPNWCDTIRIWRKQDGEIVGVVNSETPDDLAFLHVDAAHREIQAAMVEWAEAHIALSKDGEGPRIRFLVREGDGYSEALLQERSYTQLAAIEYLRWRSLAGPPVDEASPPEGLSFRSVADGVNMTSRHACTALAFRSEPLSTEIYDVTQSAPSYRADLDLCIVDAGGRVVAICTVWLDEANSLGYFEPVATHPGHQHRSLGKTILAEGMRRLRELGAEVAYVGAEGEARGAFYDAAGFTESIVFRQWERTLPA